MSTKLLTSIGYAGLELAQLAYYVNVTHATVVDVRFTARSQNTVWNKDNLLTVLSAEHYVHVWQLGNRNYKDKSKPVEFVDLETGRLILQSLFMTRTQLVLLCACYDAERCHRTAIFDYMRTRLALATGDDLQYRHLTLKQVTHVDSVSFSR